MKDMFVFVDSQAHWSSNTIIMFKNKTQILCTPWFSLRLQLWLGGVPITMVCYIDASCQGHDRRLAVQSKGLK